MSKGDLALKIEVANLRKKEAILDTRLQVKNVLISQSCLLRSILTSKKIQYYSEISALTKIDLKITKSDNLNIVKSIIR